MNTNEAYNNFKAGLRVGVVVTNANNNENSVHEIDGDAWKRRVINKPDNTNYVLLPNV